ncbi:unnamed protein product [Ilex paraguariensis]|uniref:Leucine-rich repeat-containing N-terminal plant-type domain-containing protein n=1 Tax=Ilex paraguariensis TaxID=185542 RepID=A0ABC8QSQ8_9AQUA
MATWGIFLQFLSVLSFLLFAQFVSLEANELKHDAGNLNLRCIEVERKALIKFREGLTDPSGQLAAWVGKDCCKWQGVHCSNITGNVVSLSIRNRGDCYTKKDRYGADYNGASCLGGEISPSLLDLKHLKYLDLSVNDFHGIPIPDFLGSFEKIRYLNLSYSCFSGIVPPQLGNLSSLRYLDLFASSNPNSIILTGLVSDLSWISELTSLEYLDLGYVDLSSAKSGWLQALNTLPSLWELSVPYCGLQNLPYSLPSLNFTSLLVLDLSYNSFNASVLPQWLFNISSLVDLTYSNLKFSLSQVGWEHFCNFSSLDLTENQIRGDISVVIGDLSRCSDCLLEKLDLRHNQLSGEIPESLGNLKNLKFLGLDENFITGTIPESIGGLSKLDVLNLGLNQLSGTIPESVGKLAELTRLELYQNSWEGVLSQNHLQGLKNLVYFSISSSNRNFVVNVSDDWLPPFSLRFIDISSCTLGPKFPTWLRNQKQLSSVILTDVAISDTIPDWLWELCPQIQKLDLSGNQISGVLPNSLEFSSETRVVVDFRSNRLEGQLPLWSNLTNLILADNLFSGSIPRNIGQVLSEIQVLDLSGNFLNGGIPTSIGGMKYLKRLDLSNNLLSGEIHGKWGELQELLIIDLSRNNLSGNIPSSICSPPLLFWLKLSRNNLSRELESLQNCTSLTTLDLGENKFSGIIPRWIGESLLSLTVLRIRDNMFYGGIPDKLCHLSSLHILDLALNKLSGSIPSCLGNLSGLSSLTSYNPTSHFRYQIYRFIPQMEVTVKGKPTIYNLTLNLVHIIDLSSNKLRGDIPEEITHLSTLGTLNLSRNRLTGEIPEKIDGLKKLETLDLSFNHLSGPIPPTMSSMTLLSYLNLSYNNLSGQIPSTTQFQTFDDPFIYEGNAELCGSPLPTPCFTHKDRNADRDAKDSNDEDENEMLWFYLGMGLGFVVGFWAVIGSLEIKKSWRQAYFGFLYRVRDWLFVFIALNAARLKRKMKRGRN